MCILATLLAMLLPTCIAIDDAHALPARPIQAVCVRRFGMRARRLYRPAGRERARLLCRAPTTAVTAVLCQPCVLALGQRLS